MRRIERIGPDGVERVRAVRLRALEDSPDAFWTTLDEELATPAERWRERLAAPDAATFLAHRDGLDLGLVVGAPHHEGDGGAGLYAMWVAPETRGAGVGDALVAAVVAWARSAGHRTLRLEVADLNEKAIRLYARAGFTPTGATSTMPAPREHLTEHERALALTPPPG